ncbi:aldo/keto reductase [Halobellus limi]|uniref:Alcohol dehydrogenase n=1 Tax=Halobellus limi TaxID=699433 RepID=A0A1H6B6X6_9EURY|nr:aldo/keto reductase [Halobellus limi]QCC49176.1 alcohol dehydrogenase [Halobellus limi]SEG56613.1 alcohol dehydrogenase (NADP+) [Halobellus limi]
MKCAFVGAGAVAGKYASGFGDSPLELAAVCDLDADRAERLAAAHGATPYADLDDLLAAESVPLIVNLASHAAHADVTRTCLEADRHVFGEKPLALDADRALGLVETADRRGLALGCAPINHRCDAQRHARSLLGDGRLGPIRLGYAHAHVGRVTEWHDRPDSFLDVGPLYDGAVYPLSLLVSWFGPAEAIRSADALDVWPDREAQTPERPPHVEATIQFASGPVVRLTASLYAPHRSREFNSLELHGDDGSLYLADSGALAAERDAVSVGGAGRPYVSAPHPQPRRERRYLGGPERLADAVRDGRAPTRGARRAAHVVAVCNAIERAASEGSRVRLPEAASEGVDPDAPRPPPIRPPPRGATTRHDPETDADSTARRDPDRGAGSTAPLVRDAAIRLPPVGFGCSRYRDGEYVDRIDAIATALDAGYRLFDSAELYGNETRIGELLDSPGSPDREGLFLVGKVWNTNHEHVAEACRGSLAELGIDAFDSYLLHWPEAWAYQGPLSDLASKPVAEQEALTFPTDSEGDPETVDVSLEATWRRLERLHDRGFTRTLGVCNVSLPQLERIVEVARVPPAIVQVESHPYRPRSELVEWCHARGIRVVAHSPLSAPGLLDEPVLRDVAEEHGVAPATVALAFHVDRGVVPIPASNDSDHVVANLAAARVRLTDDDRERLATLEDAEFER